MSRETWGTFSVNDHVAAWPFVCDLMLFDRLRIPIPAKEDWEEWDKVEGWQPERQEAVLEVLGDRARPIVWGAAQRAKWRERWLLAQETGQATQAAAFQMTRDQLIESLPRGVTGVQSVASYPDYETLSQEFGLQERAGEIRPPPASVVAAVLGRRFLVPSETTRKPDDFGEELDLLRRVVRLTSGRTYQRRRAGYWRWQREFSDGTITDQETIEAAAREMDELLKEESVVIRRQKIDTVARYAFLLCTVTVGLLAGPLSPITVGSAFLTVGQFAWTEARADDSRHIEGRTPDEAKVVALCQDSRKRFGMT